MSDKDIETTPETTPSEERDVLIIDYTRAKRAAAKVAKWGAKIVLPLAAVGAAAYLAGHSDGVEDALAYEEALEEAKDLDTTEDES